MGGDVPPGALPRRLSPRRTPRRPPNPAPSSPPSCTAQLDVSSYVTSAAISTSGSYLAFGDAEGSTHVWSSTDPGADDAEAGLTFNGFGGVLPEFADEVPPLPKIDWNETT